MPPYRYHVRTTQTADDQLLELLVNHSTLRNAITRASNDFDRVLGMGPPNQGSPCPTPAYPNRREIVISPLVVAFEYAANGLEVVVTELTLVQPPPYGPP
jgi:hypothetical protein